MDERSSPGDKFRPSVFLPKAACSMLSMRVANVPPEKTPLTLKAVREFAMSIRSVDAGLADSLNVWRAMKTERSEGTESNPQEGTTRTSFLCAV